MLGNANAYASDIPIWEPNPNWMVSASRNYISKTKTPELLEAIIRRGEIITLRIIDP